MDWLSHGLELVWVVVAHKSEQRQVLSFTLAEDTILKLIEGVVSNRVNGGILEK